MNELIRKICSKYDTKWDDRFKIHKSQPDLSFQEYSKSKKIELGNQVSKKIRIYLDLKYWIYLRDAYYGNPQKKIHNEIATCLYRLSEIGLTICPSNWLIANEILKQKEAKRRFKTSKIVDDLSHNIIIEPLPILVEIELLHLLSQLVDGKEKVYRLNQLVWNHGGNLLGETIPSNTSFDNETETVLQKTFLDVISDVKFSKMIEIFVESNIKPPPFNMPDYEKGITIETDKHRNEFSTYSQVYEIELYGFLDAIKDDIYKAFKYLYLKKTGKTLTKKEEEYVRIRKLAMNLIFHAYRLNKLSTEFPQLHINVGIHSVIRYKNMPFKKGDFYDHLHACSAIPYCNYFFTERKLCNLLIQEPLYFDKVYNCMIIYEEEQVLEELKQLTLKYFKNHETDPLVGTICSS